MRAEHSGFPVKFSVVTPCLNAAARIEETVASVSAQAAVRDGRVALEHIICDGGSTDGTLEILRRIEQPHMRISSQKDGGMYDALARGLREASGDVLAYINAGDYFHPHAFNVVTDIMAAFPHCRWLTGWAVLYNAAGAVVRLELPPRYRRRLVRCGAYGGFLQNVQQESTFWRRELMQAVDLGRLARFRLAGDYYLWRCFAERTDLHIVSAQLGGFRREPGQLSADLAGYREEMLQLADRAGPLDWLAMLADRLAWYLPPAAKKFLNPDRLHLYDHQAARWT
jgi:glycosyltransferase involved in cell wall biosynthesis